MIPKTRHRPIAINIKAVVSPQEVLNKADWEGFPKYVDIGITEIVPTPDNYGSFVNFIKKASRQNIPHGCHTSYICGLTNETTETGNKLSNEIAEAQQKKWQALIQFFFTHSSRNA